MIDDKLCRFYSPDWMARLLIESLPIEIPATVVDLGSGPGSLARAAAFQWPTSSFVTVDIDPGQRVDLEPILASPTHHRHVCADVADAELIEPSLLRPNSFDLAISNPPYAVVDCASEVDGLWRRAGLDAKAPAWSEFPLDTIFLLQALALLRDGGIAGFIVPDSMISGRPNERFRKALLDNHNVRRVIQLPRRAFVGTDAQAFILILSKGGSSDIIGLSRVDATGTVSEDIHISRLAGARRLDFDFHKTATKSKDRISLRELGVEVRRGRASSVEVAQSIGAIFHTSDFPAKRGSQVSLSKGTEAREGTRSVHAFPGDILVARVDRRLEDKIALVADGRSEISDCVLRLRCPPEYRTRILNGLASDHGREQLQALSRGTGARHIAAAELLNLMV
jgi:type I restriction enzyme M protein